MNAVRFALLGVSLVLVFGVADATGQARKKGPGKLPQLVAQEILDQLKLTAAQKQRVAQLEDEFARQVKQKRAGMRQDYLKAKANNDKAALKRLQASNRLAVEEIRRAMEPRFVQLLSAAQKKKYEELKKDMPVKAPAGRFAPTPPQTVKGTIQKLDPDKGTLQVTVDGQSQTYVVSRATKLLDAAGTELSNGLTDKALAPGAKVSLTINRPTANARRANVLELRLIGK